MSKPIPERDLVVNRRARHDYHLLDRFEAGIVLVGSEVKSLRAGNGNIRQAHVSLRRGSAFLEGCHIATYTEANRNNHEPVHPRRLLLHSHELSKLLRATTQKGMTIVPVRIYLKGSWIKVEIALAKGKKQHDKRHDLKAKNAKRDMDRAR